MKQTVLVLGATGRFGRNVATAFARNNWTVRKFDRRTDDLMQAANGADMIIAGWNPPYQDWAAQVQELHARIRQAALANDATVLLPGNLYVFGHQTPAPWGANSPHQATNPLGLIRRRMEEAYRREGVRTILLRAGDYLDTEASGNWFDMVMAKKLAKGVLTYPGRLDAAHAWAYLPDLARAAVDLADKRDALQRFEDIPFAGYTLTGTELAQTLSRALGHPVSARQMSWLPLHLLRPFDRSMKHLLEMRYLWNTPHSLDATRLRAVLPDFQATPAEQALRMASSHAANPVQRAMSTQTS
ncbi:epimerase [Thalassovita sp.]|uniref:epimerase n=1 Tax=Thalassovita sp. TaxID=1979401 RepID=UPI0029DE7758|nr:epimerase [Thalassovita sp.]